MKKNIREELGLSPNMKSKEISVLLTATCWR